MNWNVLSRNIMLGLVVFIGFGLSSCTPPVKNEEGSTPSKTTAYQGYVVQLIASHCDARAESIKDDFLIDGYTAFVNPLMVDKQMLYRVQIGPYVKRVEAQRVLKQLQQRYPRNPHVKLAIIKRNP